MQTNKQTEEPFNYERTTDQSKARKVIYIGTALYSVDYSFKKAKA